MDHEPAFEPALGAAAELAVGDRRGRRDRGRFTAAQALLEGGRDLFEDVSVGQVDARKPGRGVFGQDQGDAEDSRARERRCRRRSIGARSRR